MGKPAYELDVCIYYDAGINKLKKDFPAFDMRLPGNKQQPLTSD
ncbi:hypothetical protein ACFOU2_06035 [Bacillus songklensis]|uniref:Uncharacterized protein n=1 Tax=Bacillus songklensis TaxID=1069116 RepID=A0ABV8B1P9_9BACI